MRRHNKLTRLTPTDLQVFKDVNFRLCEMPEQSVRMPEGMPMLWSPLAYVLSQEHGCLSTGHIWERYRLVQQLAAHRDAHYHTIFIPKNGGGVRQLEIPDESLRREQSWICRRILSGCKVSSHAFAYVKGRTMRECAAVHAGSEMLIHLDIRNFFGSITEEMVAKALQRNTNYPAQAANFLAKLCCAHYHLPQGGIASPMLSNIVFQPLDEELGQIAERNDCVYSRYADDIFLSGSLISPDWLLWEVEELLRSAGFRLNDRKSRIIWQGRRMQVLGITTNTTKLQVNRAYRRQVRQEVYYLLKYGPMADGVGEAGGVLPYARQLLGKVSYILQINPDDEWACQAGEELRELLRRGQREGDPYERALFLRRQQLTNLLERAARKKAKWQMTSAFLQNELCGQPVSDFCAEDGGFRWNRTEEECGSWRCHAVFEGSALRITAISARELPREAVRWSLRMLNEREDSESRPRWLCEVFAKRKHLCCSVVAGNGSEQYDIAKALLHLKLTMRMVHWSIRENPFLEDDLFPIIYE